MSSREALNLAMEQGLDLVEVAPDAEPPVCKIMNFGKFRYELNKRAKEAKKKQHVIHLKEIRFRPKTEEHDYQVKIRQVKEFLRSHCKVKVAVMFRGREIMHLDFGKRILDRITEDLKDLATVEQPQRKEGRNLVIFLIPK